MCFKEQVADSVTLFFAISDHSESVDLIHHGSAAAKAPLVEGKWDLMSVPYGEGRIGGDRMDHMVLSLGFDTYQILDVIERVEPSSAIFLTPNRGDGSKIDEVANQQLALLRQRFSYEFDTGHFEAMLVPPYGLDWVPELSGKVRAMGKDGGALLLYPFGPKVHSIGLSLLALQREDAAVIGRIPTSYFHRSVDATGHAFVSTLTDLSSPTSRVGKPALTADVGI
jgi:hypothetical protein